MAFTLSNLEWAISKYIFKLESPLVKWCYLFPYAQRVLNAFWCGHVPHAQNPCARLVKSEANSSPLHSASFRTEDAFSRHLLPNHLQVSTSSMIKKKTNKRGKKNKIKVARWLPSIESVSDLSSKTLLSYYCARRAGVEGGGNVQKVLSVLQVNF